MHELFLNAIVFGAMVGALALAMPAGRRRGAVALVLALIGTITGLVMGVLVPSDLWRLPMDTGLGGVIALTLGQAALAMVAVAAGRPWLPGPAFIVAPLTGALLGEIGGAVLLAGTTEDRGARARLALGAAAGGFLGRMADPGMLLLGPEGLGSLRFAPLVLVALPAARPRAGDLAGRADGDKAVTAIGLGAAVATMIPGFELVAVTLGVVSLGGLAVVRRRQDRGGHLDATPLAWAAGAAILVLVATAAGTPAVIGLGIEEVQNAFMAWGPAAMFGAGALVSALAGGHGAALLAQAVLDRTLALNVPDAAAALAMGVSVGGLGPLLAVGALRAGWTRWLLQVVLVGAVGLWLL